MADLTYAEGLAASLPVKDETSESDLISLVDIVITGVETPWHHFGLLSYKPEADGVEVPWATITPLSDSGAPNACDLYASTIREAVTAYLQARLDSGMAPAEAAKMVDGSYTDAVVADSILQFALYGEEIYS